MNVDSVWLELENVGMGEFLLQEAIKNNWHCNYEQNVYVHYENGLVQSFTTNPSLLKGKVNCVLTYHHIAKTLVVNTSCLPRLLSGDPYNYIENNDIETIYDLFTRIVRYFGFYIIDKRVGKQIVTAAFWKIKEIHYCHDFDVGSFFIPIYLERQLKMELNGYKKTVYPAIGTPESIYYTNAKYLTLVFYNKEKCAIDKQKSPDEIKKSAGLLRFEVRMKGTHLRSMLNKKNVRLKDAISIDVIRKAIKKNLEKFEFLEYPSISLEQAEEKIKNINMPLNSIKSRLHALQVYNQLTNVQVKTRQIYNYRDYFHKLKICPYCSTIKLNPLWPGNKRRTKVPNKMNSNPSASQFQKFTIIYTSHFQKREFKRMKCNIFFIK